MNIRSKLRPVIRRLVAPVWHRVWMRIEARVAPVESKLSADETRLSAHEARLSAHEARLSAHEARLSADEARLDAFEAAWRTHVPAFLNAVSSVGAFGHKLLEVRGEAEAQARRAEQFQQELWRLADRIEFARREVMFEMAHGGGSAEAQARRSERLEPKIIAREKLATARAAGGIRLNLGCGHIPLPGYLNVDRRELPGVDIVADVNNLPFEPGTVSEIFSAHLVEHFPQERMRRQLLPYWRDLLCQGSAFRTITPDAAAMIAAACHQSSYQFDDFREVLFGAQDYEGDYHYNLFTPESMRRLLEEVGFRDIEVPVSGRRNGKCFEFEIVAARP